MLENNSNAMLWTVGAIAVAGLLILAAKAFFPDLFDNIQDRIQDNF